MKVILNNALRNDIGVILEMSAEVYSHEGTVGTTGTIGGYSIGWSESDTVTTYYTYKNVEDRDTDLETLKKLILTVLWDC